jgi:hypothetical protein
LSPVPALTFVLLLVVVLQEPERRGPALWCFQEPPQSRWRLPRHFGTRSIRAHDELEPHSILADIFRQSSFPPASTTDCPLRLRTQFICRDDENRVRNRIWNIDHLEISSLSSLTDRNARILTSAYVLQSPVPQRDQQRQAAARSARPRPAAHKSLKHYNLAVRRSTLQPGSVCATVDLAEG